MTRRGQPPPRGRGKPSKRPGPKGTGPFHTPGAAPDEVALSDLTAAQRRVVLALLEAEDARQADQDAAESEAGIGR